MGQVCAGTGGAGAGQGVGGSGAVTGTGGAVVGTGGAVNGTGGAVNGTGGAVNGTGGAVAGTGGVIGTGGAVAGTGGVIGTGATGTGAVGGSGGPLGGYHVHGDWSGFAFAFATDDASITPGSFEDMINQDGPYCVSGTVAGTEEYSSIAAVGVNTKQPKIEDAPVEIISASGSGLLVDVKVNSGEDGIRVQLEDGTDPEAADAAEHRWCVNLTADTMGTISTTIPWETFNTECWSAEDGTAFDPAVNKIAKVIFYVPDDGATQQSFDFCLNDVGPADVMGRGEGQIVSACGNSVTWQGGNPSDQFAKINSNGDYRFQSNGWNQSGGDWSISLLDTVGFKMNSQSCSTSTDAPCSFPSVYIGTNFGGDARSNNFTARPISQISSIPTCLGWASNGTSGQEYNVAYDVWFNSDAGASSAQKFLMVWFHDPPSFQPGGMFPIQDGVVIGGQTWSVWSGPNADGQTTTSYVAPNGLADGMAYQFDLKDFIDDALTRTSEDNDPALTESLNLIAVMAGLEIWGGASGAQISGFSAEVQSLSPAQ